MRIGVTAAFLTLLVAAPAAAADPIPGIALATRTLTAPVPGAPFSLLRISMADSERSRPFRLDDPDTAVHRRLLGAMIDYYPFGTSGLHLSGGTLRTTRGGGVAQSQSRIIAVGRRDFGYHSLRQRFAPAMTVGYTLPIARTMQAGFEVGGVSGGMNAMPSGPTSMFLGDAGMRRAHAGSGVKAIANLAFGMRF